MLNRVWALLRATVEGYIEDEAMGRGAAIAYYTIFSIAPLLVIATATAGFFFGEAAVQGALAEELRGLVGESSAETVQSMVAGASNRTSGTIATLVGVVTLLFTASGVFGELQSALNPGWEVTEPARQRIAPDPYHAGQNLVEQIPTGEWVERAHYFEAVAVTGDGVFETLKAISKLVLKALA